MEAASVELPRVFKYPSVMGTMRYLDATLKLPPELRHPMEEYMRESDAIEHAEILAWNLTPERVEYVLAYVDGAMEPYRERIESVDTIRDAMLSRIEEGSFYVYVCQETREADQQWRQAFDRRSLVVVPPIVYDEGGTRLTVVGAAEDLRALLAGIPDRIDVNVEEVSNYDRRHATVAGGMTDRQLEAVSVAVELGYYRVPREADLGDVAGALECAESTASNLLRKAEASVMDRLVGAG